MSIFYWYFYYFKLLHFKIFSNLIANWCSIFLVNLSFTNIIDLMIFLHASLWEKHVFSKSKPQIDVFWPRDFFVVIAKDRQFGNWSILNGIGDSEVSLEYVATVRFMFLLFSSKWFVLEHFRWASWWPKVYHYIV